MWTMRLAPLLLAVLTTGEKATAAPLPIHAHGRNASSAAHAPYPRGVHTQRGDSPPLARLGAAPTWELVSRMPQARLGLTSSYDEVSGRIYSLGGEQFATTGDWAESVNPSVDIAEWRVEDPMPVARFQAAAAAMPGRVYTMGGFGVEGSAAPIDSMVSIDTASGQWRTETPMPTPRALLSAVYVPGGRIYAMGGRGAQDPFDPVVPTVESYDPVTGDWTEEADMPEQRQGAAGVYVPEVNRIYVLGGGNGNGAELPTVDSMDVATGQWRSETPMPTQRTLITACTTNGRVYVIGGVGPAGAGTAVESLDTSTGEWRTEPSLPDDRWQSSAVAAAGAIFAIGGNSNGGQLATVVTLPTPPEA